MPISGLIKFGLGLANVPSELVGEIEAALPGAERLIGVMKMIEPDLRLLQPVVEKLMPIVQQAFPLFEQAEPLIAESMAPVARIIAAYKAEQGDIRALLPLAQKILAFADGK